MNSLENAQHVRDTIAQNTPRMSRPILRTLLKSALLPFLIFLAALVVSGYARRYVDSTFQNDGLSLLTALSTSLLMLVLTWRAWQWSERRFGGWANVNRMFALVSSVARLEKAINAGNETSPADLDAAAQSAWDTYESLAQKLGIAA